MLVSGRKKGAMDEKGPPTKTYLDRSKMKGRQTWCANEGSQGSVQLWSIAASSGGSRACNDR